MRELRDLLRFVTEPRVSILGGLGFVAFYELIQDDHWLLDIITISVTAVIVWLGRK